ncbi:MAG: hypothetical protein IT204_17225 [Fimbriimonadaceae bacterium]|nr:hypothetical protein [Fimbriimonadaceae bacterium]
MAVAWTVVVLAGGIELWLWWLGLQRCGALRELAKGLESGAAAAIKGVPPEKAGATQVDRGRHLAHDRFSDLRLLTDKPHGLVLVSETLDPIHEPLAEQVVAIPQQIVLVSLLATVSGLGLCVWQLAGSLGAQGDAATSQFRSMALAFGPTGLGVLVSLLLNNAARGALDAWEMACREADGSFTRYLAENAQTASIDEAAVALGDAAAKMGDHATTFSDSVNTLHQEVRKLRAGEISDGLHNATDLFRQTLDAGATKLEAALGGLARFGQDIGQVGPAVDRLAEMAASLEGTADTIRGGFEGVVSQSALLAEALQPANRAAQQMADGMAGLQAASGDVSNAVSGLREVFSQDVVAQYERNSKALETTSARFEALVAQTSANSERLEMVFDQVSTQVAALEAMNSGQRAMVERVATQQHQTAQDLADSLAATLTAAPPDLANLAASAAELASVAASLRQDQEAQRHELEGALQSVSAALVRLDQTHHQLVAQQAAERTQISQALESLAASSLQFTHLATTLADSQRVARDDLTVAVGAMQAALAQTRATAERAPDWSPEALATALQGALKGLAGLPETVQRVSSRLDRVERRLAETPNPVTADQLSEAITAGVRAAAVPSQPAAGAERRPWWRRWFGRR